MERSSIPNIYAAFQSCARTHLSHLSVVGRSMCSRGGALERGFKRVFNDVPVGSLLIQSDSKSGEAMLLHVGLPFYIRLRNLAEQTYVFLLDAQVKFTLCFYVEIEDSLVTLDWHGSSRLHGYSHLT